MRLVKSDPKPKNYRIVKSEVVEYTKGDYVRLGDRLRNYSSQNEIPVEDLIILQNLRTSYKTPLSQIFDILQKSIETVNADAIVTYRIKRIDSIISKLKRLGDTQLPRIEDLAGCRCILKNNKQVYQLKAILENELFIKSDRNDYIACPKADGYRSLHLIVQTKDKKSRPIEVQLRSEKDHNWATLVEITDQIYNTKIKELGNEPELGRMLYLLSKGFKLLTKPEVIELIELIERVDFVNRINSVFSNNSIKVRKQWSEIERKSEKSFYLIQVDKENNSFISSYLNFNEAERAYFDGYQKNPSHNIVLTYIPNARFTQISKAYSNYTLTYHDFFQDLLSQLQELVINSFSDNNIRGFKKYYSSFILIFFEVAKLQMVELLNINNFKCLSNKKHEWEKDLDNRMKTIIMRRVDLFKKIKINRFNIYHLIMWICMKRIWNIRSKIFMASKDTIEREIIKNTNC